MFPRSGYVQQVLGGVLTIEYSPLLHIQLVKSHRQTNSTDSAVHVSTKTKNQSLVISPYL